MVQYGSTTNPTLKADNIKLLSASIACVRFPLVIYILLLHSFTVDALSGHPLYSKAIYPFSLWIGETGVPAYFFISGLLFFYSQKTYQQKIKDRVRTLIVPYLIWNGIIILGYFSAYLLGHDSLINNDKYISEYTVIDYIRAFWDRGDWGDGNGKPILPPMWYIRNLFFLCLFSPIIKYVIQKTKMTVPLVLAFIWIQLQDDVYILQSITMFSLGAMFPILDIDLIGLLRKYKEAFFALFIVITLLDYTTHIAYTTPVNHQIHRFALILNIFATIWMGVLLSNHNITFKSYSHMVFFIFCIHLPFMILLRRPVLSHVEWNSYIHIVCYFASVILCTMICIGIYKILEKILPKFLKVSTGNRN